jgi:hypothetical protein
MRKIVAAVFALALVVPIATYAGQTHGPGAGSDGHRSGSSEGSGEHGSETPPKDCEHCNISG